MYDRILLATDGSEHAREAVEHAIGLAQVCDATLYVVSVVETRTAYDAVVADPEEIRANLKQVADDAIDDATELADAAGVQTRDVLEEGVPAEEIIEVVEREDIDLVVLGERGHSAFKTVMLGSTAETVVHETDVPVTVV